VSPSIRIAVDIGGTFTDGVAEDSRDGRIWVGKCLTTPEDPGEGVSTVVAQLLARIAATDAGLGAAAVRDVVHATTLVSNTLIERKGARIALVVTRGTADAPDIAREVRYDLYDLEIELPEPLVPAERRLELDERIGAGGVVLRPVAASGLAALADAVHAMAPDAVAVCLLHAYANDAHERAVEAALRAALPGLAISLSARVAPEMREYERMSTTAANAYVQPLMARYLGALERRLRDAGIPGALRVMLSSGGFGGVGAAAAAPIQLLESGPAAGVLSAVNTGEAAGERQILAFDMGGTTAKACVVTDAEPTVVRGFEAARVRRFKKGSGLPILVPSVDLIEIGAGGGSIAAVSAVGTLAVGPHSAGAVPGPVSYGRGGTEPTVTDADLMLGYLDAERFLGGEMRLDRGAAEAAFAALGARLGVPALDAAWGVCSVVNETMAGAARVHIAEKGFDPRRFTMVATGGAGPVHAVDVARRLRIGRVLCPLAAGAGSCLGLLAAAPRAERALARRSLLAEVDWPGLAAALGPLRAEAERELAAAGADPQDAEWAFSLDMRYAGQGHNVDVVLPWAEPGPLLRDRMGAGFDARYRHLYGALVPDAEVEVVTWRLIGRAPRATRLFRWADGRAGRPGTAPRTRRPIFLPAERRFAEAPVYDRYALPPGTALDGPLVLEERESTVVVPVPACVAILPDLTVRIDLEGAAP
jgi:N-methylhydantoinase A